MAKLRLFVAIEVADIIKKKLKECQERLKEARGDVGWVNVENIHITLKFLGYLEEEHLACVKDIVNQSIQDIKPFSLQFKGIGAFPRFQRPRVVFVAAKDKEGYLVAINSRLEDGFQSLGVEKEDRVFEPHLTLGRVRTPRNMEKLVKVMEKYRDEPFGEELVSRILLMRSQLTPEGSIYTTLDTFPLGALSENFNKGSNDGSI